MCTTITNERLNAFLLGHGPLGATMLMCFNMVDPLGHQYYAFKQGKVINLEVYLDEIQMLWEALMIFGFGRIELEPELVTELVRCSFRRHKYSTGWWRLDDETTKRLGRMVWTALYRPANM